MKSRNIIFTVLISISMLLLAYSPAAAETDSSNSDAALCIPGELSTFSVSDCSKSGPVQRLDELAAIGITFPPQPLLVTKPPYELTYSEFSYAQVSNEEVSLYNSLEEAAANKPSGKLEKSRIKYVSLVDKGETANGVFYKTSMGKWISGNVITKVGIQYFQGFLFKENPTVPFGWIKEEVTPRSTPGYSGELTGKVYYGHTIVPAYSSQVVNDVEWVMIGPNEWIEHRFINRVIPNYEKPLGVNADRWIEINLYEQVMIVHEGDRLVFATLISSGSDPFFTQPGVFTIYKEFEHDYMRGAFETDRSDYYYLEDVPYIMYYDQARALHGAYWHTNFGNMRSHGCVNLSVADSHWLFDWADVGDYVYVWDPSGQTPTDPSFYGAGGI